MSVTRFAPHICKCGYEMDASMPVVKGDPGPQEDDVSICFVCGRLWLFNQDLTMREPSKRELIDLEYTPAWKMIKEARDKIMMKPPRESL